MAGHDFVDLERRKLKAGKIAAQLRTNGMTADLVVACAADTKWLRQVERDAGVAKSSDATWALAVQDLARRPPTFEQDRRPGCGCHVDPDTGVLYEFNGWPCPHGSEEHPGSIDPAVANAVARVEALAEFEKEQRTPKEIEVPPSGCHGTVDLEHAGYGGYGLVAGAPARDPAELGTYTADERFAPHPGAEAIDPMDWDV